MILRAVEAGEGPVLVLLHGLFGQARNFGAVQKRLAERYRVLALDLRNHGLSPHAPGMTYAEMAEDVLGTLRKLGALPCALLGHSMGGKVAMTVALSQPAAVERLLVADIAPVVYPPAFRAAAAAMRRLELVPGLSRAEADRALIDGVPDPSMRAFLLQNLDLAAGAWRIGLVEIAEAMPGIEGWRDPPASAYAAPCLFLAGARSDYIRPEYRPAILKLFPAARFATLKGAGHWLHADNADGFSGVIDGFMTGVRSQLGA